MKKMKVGIIGCGTIGTELARILRREFQRSLSVACLADHHAAKAQAARRLYSPRAKVTSNATLIRQCDIIIEAASATCSAAIAHQVLRQKKHVLIMSVGGLLQDKSLSRHVNGMKGKLWIPSGALSGIDALLAAKEGRLRSVRLVTKKPPAGLREAPYFQKHKFPTLRGSRPVRVFKGTARSAVRAFPQNVNVAAILSLAGIGDRKTQVEIWTSRSFRRNQHEVYAEGDFGTVQTITQNRPSRNNPKTSYLAVLSAVATIRKMLANVRVGT
ncbi:MAG: DUF108 domain-containing protein [Candidatus Omnitrophota bacterium]|nr:DUF108 domain-containing protein [Candidatus Omnitrophota bacterium]